MSTRELIEIDEEKCDGCGQCISGCPEGALQIIEGKARLVSDLLCDGLGACIGECPRDAITKTLREAEPYDEAKVMENLWPQGMAVVQAHLEHLKIHGEHDLLAQAMAFLLERRLAIPDTQKAPRQEHSGGCPGSRTMSFAQTASAPAPGSSPTHSAPSPSALTHWPVQLHLVNPSAPHFQNADLVLCADCVPFAMADFHSRFLTGRKLAIACPKLDEGQESYAVKLSDFVSRAYIRTLTVLIMQVPCCRGLLSLAQMAVSQSGRKVPIQAVVVSVQGEVLSDEWV